MSDVLPVCSTREVRGRVQIDGQWCVPCFCMNCHKQKGFMSEPDPARPGYVGFLCDDCAEKHGAPVGTMLSPCVARALRANEAMENSYGRVLTDAEQLVELDDVNSVLSKIARSL